MKNKRLKRKISATLPIINVIVFVLVGYLLADVLNVPAGYAWAGLILLTIPVQYMILGIWKFEFIYPVFIVLLYVGLCLLLQLVLNIKLWHPLWVLFLTIPIYYTFRDKNKGQQVINE